jgi:hypothetical protein
MNIHLGPVKQKACTMNKEKIQQFCEESDSWKRALQFLQSENNYLKLRLAHILANEVSPKLLAQAENLQHQLIQKDEIIALNKMAVSDFDKYVNHEYPVYGNNIKEIINRHRRARRQIEMSEGKFSEHRAMVNDYLNENF